MEHARIQLTLFVDEHESEEIESIRNKYNPEQYSLIPSHVTLCREDELGTMETVSSRLEKLVYPELIIKFGPVRRFADGKGVFIPGFGNNSAFQQLRHLLLSETMDYRKHEPHITLMHPRNSTCTDELFSLIQEVELPRQLVFKKISLIRQKIDGPWKILKQFDLVSEKVQGQ